MCYNQTGDISTLEGTPLKLVDKFTYLGSSVESTEKDIETRLTKAWTAINRLSTIWKSDLTDKMKRSFFQAAVIELLYGCTMDANKTAGEETRWQLHKNAACNPQQVLAATPHKTPTVRPPAPYTKTIQVRRTRHAGHCWRSRDELIRDVLPHTRPRKSRTTSTNVHSAAMSGYRLLSSYLGRWYERGCRDIYDDDDIYMSVYLPICICARLWTRAPVWVCEREFVRTCVCVYVGLSVDR